MRSRFSEEQIVDVLHQHAAGVARSQLCRDHQISVATFYKWKAKFSGMQVEEAKCLRRLEAENAKLKRVVADLTSDNVTLRDVLSKNW